MQCDSDIEDEGDDKDNMCHHHKSSNHSVHWSPDIHTA